MKILLFGAGLLALVQSGGAARVNATTAGDRLSVPVPCVPTAPMPIARPGSPGLERNRMPVVKADTTLLAPMPVLRLEACYLLEASPRTLLPIR